MYDDTVRKFVEFLEIGFEIFLILFLFLKNILISK